MKVLILILERNGDCEGLIVVFPQEMEVRKGRVNMNTITQFHGDGRGQVKSSSKLIPTTNAPTLSWNFPPVCFSRY